MTLDEYFSGALVSMAKERDKAIDEIRHLRAELEIARHDVWQCSHDGCENPATYVSRGTGSKCDWCWAHCPGTCYVNSKAAESIKREALEEAARYVDGYSDTWAEQLADDLRALANSTNQCDGCCAGKPVDENGNHRMGEGNYPDLMACQAQRYAPNPTDESEG